jgi:hypothetical protein
MAAKLRNFRDLREYSPAPSSRRRAGVGALEQEFAKLPVPRERGGIEAKVSAERFESFSVRQEKTDRADVTRMPRPSCASA